MTQQSLEIHPNAYARIIGLLYLIIAISGGFAIGYVPTVIITDGDAAATAQALIDNQGLFRLGVLADVVVLLAEIVITVMLYMLFKPTSPTLSLIAAYARFSMIMVMAVNILINIMPLILLNDGTIEPEKWQNLTLTLFKAHQYGVYIWGILFGLHLLVLGYLVLVSGYFHRVFGWMLLVGSGGYIIEGVTQITATHSDILSLLIVSLLTLVTLGELSFALRLLIKGLDITAWRGPVGRSVAG